MDQVEEIKAKVDIVDFTRQYLTLKKAGINFSATCPFHSEKTPSFMVSAERQTFKCFGCFPRGELIQVENGFLEIEKIKQGDRVFTDKGTLSSVDAIIGRRYSGDLVEIQTRMVNHKISITGDHKVFVIKTQHCKQKARTTRICQKNCRQNCPTKFFNNYKIEKISARELKINDFLIYPIKKSINCLAEINILDYIGEIPNRSKKAFVFDPIIRIDSRLAELLGYYIAEGSNNRAYIRFSLSRFEVKLADRILKLANEIFALEGSKHFRSDNRNGLEVTICNSLLAKVFASLCGKGANNKQIPNVLLGQDDQIKTSLVEAILKGDGTITKKTGHNSGGRKSITTISLILAHQLKDILISLNQRPSILSSNAYISKDGVCHKSSYKINWRENDKSHFSDFIEKDGTKYWTLPVRSIKKSSFSGYVYNLNIKGDHSYLTPSFAVANCGEGGDVITFFQKIEGLSFPEALKILGERVGVQVQFSKGEDFAKTKHEKDRIFDINLLCAKFFKMSLSKKEGEKALRYLTSRGLGAKTIEKLKIGFAPADNKTLERIIANRKISFSDLSLAGHPERFRYRTMFPIFDNFSLITGFSGRILEDGLPSNVSPHPKYLNTPETNVFHKSKAIYGINFAKDAIRKNNRVIVVEGQMDVALAHEAGIEEVVASSGTALTYDHLKILSRLTRNIVFCFDEDEAGQKAANSAVEMALEMGLDVKLTIIAKYKDVGELVEKDKKLLKGVIDEALPPVEWLFAKVGDKDKVLIVDEKKTLARKAINFIKRFQDEVEKAHYVSFLAKRLAVPEVTILKILDKTDITSRVAKEEEKKSSDSIEDYFIAYLLNFPDQIKDVDISGAELKEAQNLPIYKKLLNCYNSNQIKACLDKLKQSLSREDKERLDVVSLAWDQKIKEDEEIAKGEFLAIKTRLQQKRREVTKNDFAKKIAEAESKGDMDQVKKLMKALQDEFKN
ncbi:MAG: DNA primase [bacterium]